MERQAADPRSTLTFVRRLAALRAPALQTGAQRSLDVDADVLACCARAGATGCWPR